MSAPKRVFISRAIGLKLADRYGSEGVGTCAVDVVADQQLDVVAGDISEPQEPLRRLTPRRTITPSRG